MISPKHPRPPVHSLMSRFENREAHEKLLAEAQKDEKRLARQGA